MTGVKTGLVGACVGLLSACTFGSTMPREAMPTDSQARLDAIVAGGGDRQRAAPGAAIAVWADGDILWSAASGAAAFHADGLTVQRDLRANDPVRAASMSKLATALTASALAQEGVVDLRAPIEPLLGFQLPVPNGGQVTIEDALAHVSGICDPQVYWAPLGASLESLMTQEAACEYPPGEGWTYANINYALVAQALENATGERFDVLSNRYVISPLGLDGGFNGAGMSAQRRAEGATLHRWIDGRWLAQVDDEATLSGPIPTVLRDQSERLADYQPGTNGTLFSPQGGLRVGVEDLARLAAAFLPEGPGAGLGAPVWRGSELPGVRAWGGGPQVLVEGQVPGRAGLSLVGHGGEAYGLYGGNWAVPACSAAVAFYVTGSDPAYGAERDQTSGLTWWEDQLLTLALDELETLTGCRALQGE